MEEKNSEKQLEAQVPEEEIKEIQEEIKEIQEETPVFTMEDFKRKIRELAEENHQQRVAEFLNNNTLSLNKFSGVKRHRSIRRAIRRGLVSLYGDEYPKRPFSNRKRTKGTATYDRRKTKQQLEQSGESTNESND